LILLSYLIIGFRIGGYFAIGAYFTL
jgi:hypothetical protein